MLAAAPNTTDWITAGAGVFAAVGTVGAVIVALWQSKAALRRRIAVTCSPAYLGFDSGTVEVIALRATNDGLRPIKLDQAYLRTDDGNQMFAKFAQPNAYQTFENSTLPVVLADGESLTVYWRRDRLDGLLATEGINAYVTAFYMDSQGNTYHAPYPGVVARRRWTWRRGLRQQTRYMLPADQRPSRFRFLSEDPTDYV